MRASATAARRTDSARPTKMGVSKSSLESLDDQLTEPALADETTCTQPIVVTVATRTPANIEGRASGSCTFISSWACVYPIPWAAS